MAVDGGQGRPIEGTDRTIPGATYATYEISSYNTTVLINSKGEIVERLGLYGAKEKLENMLGVEVKTTVSTWRQRFEEVYRLEDNRILKRIAPPFIPERLEYYNHEESHQAEAIPEPPDYFTFHWENNKLKKWGLGFTGGKRPLDSILRQNLSIEANKFDGPEELLQIEVPGDWIVRKPSTVEKSSSVTASTRNPSLPSLSCNAAIEGISARHGPHHVAQKLRKSTSSEYSLKVVSFPSTV